MDNLFTYIKWRGDLELSSLPFTIEDQLILATLCYVNYGAFVSPDESISIEDASRRILAKDYQGENFRVRNDYLLVQSIVSAPRFSKLIMSDVLDKFDKGHKQFFAMTVHLDPDSLIILFRGTDNTVTGWKEDFDMAYEDEVPSQAEALRYLEMVAGKYGKRIILSGHSKGGNLALYAAANASSAVRERIVRVYNNDGPGFNEHNRIREKLEAIKEKVVTIVPESSMIGMLLDHSSDYLIVASSYRLIFQHDPYSWLFDGPHFKYVPKRSEDSILFENVISSWLKVASKREREIFVDAAYKCVSSMGIDYFAESSFEILFKAPEVIRSYQNLNSEEKKVMRKIISALVHATRLSLLAKKKETQKGKTG